MQKQGNCTVKYAVAHYVGSMFDLPQRFAIDFHRNVGYIDEVDICDVIRCAAPPVATWQHIAMNDDMRWLNMLMNSKEAEILKKCHVLVRRCVSWFYHDVVYDVRYDETFVYINRKRYDCLQAYSLLIGYTVGLQYSLLIGYTVGLQYSLLIGYTVGLQVA